MIPSWSTRIPPLLLTSFLAILFLQSGLDKVIGYAGNRAYLNDYFAKSPLRATVPWMFPLLTLLEVTSGGLAAAGAGLIALGGSTWLGWCASALSGATLLALFFGQRMAKDYAGAAGLVPYFLTALIGTMFLHPPF